jgi:hypothetical protein
MWLILFRAFVVALLAHAGFVYSPFPRSPWLGLALGLVAAIGLITLEQRMRAVSGPHLVGRPGRRRHRPLRGAPGVGSPGRPRHRRRRLRARPARGVPRLRRHRHRRAEGRVVRAGAHHRRLPDSTRLYQYKVLDTSVIIDGRIADICETGFLDGTLVVPQFVLRELQQVADSSDSLKRNRGRRGLDILQKIQKMAHMQVQIVETDFPEVREVDLKLIELARRMTGRSSPTTSTSTRSPSSAACRSSTSTSSRTR